MSENGGQSENKSKGAPSLSQEEAFARIRLLRSRNIGPVTYRKLLGRFETAQRALEALPEMAARGKKRDYQPAPRTKISKEIEAAWSANARYIFHDSPEYPPGLRVLEDAPPILTVRGDTQLAASPCIAMVGARNSSAAAIKLAREFAHELAAQGYVIVSGLARGIDGAAHEGAMPATIGVIASGIDISYPPQHSALQEQIASQGLLIAEEPPGTEPRGKQFPKRNRIIAGLAAGTVVVEAAVKSGSLITARLAGEAGREVMAIPGSPLDARSQGCNKLIREGAILVQTPEDVAELIAGFDGDPKSRFREFGEAYVGAEDNWDDGGCEQHKAADIAQMLSSAPISVDELVRQSGVNAGAVQMALLELEIAGLLTRHAGGKVSL